jgi:hypothetical protein
MKIQIGNTQWATVCDRCNRTIHTGVYVADLDLCTYCINMGMIRNGLAKVAERATKQWIRHTPVFAR